MAVQGQKVRKCQISVVKEYLQKCHSLVYNNNNNNNNLFSFIALSPTMGLIALYIEKHQLIAFVSILHKTCHK